MLVTRVTGNIIKLVGKGNSITRRVMFIKDHGTTTSQMGMVCTLQLTVLDLKVTGGMIINMEKALKPLLEVPDMKAIIVWEIKMGSASTHILTELPTRVNGKMAKYRDSAGTSGQMARNSTGSGLIII